MHIVTYHLNQLWNVSCSVMPDSATPWTAAHQAPLSMRFSRQWYWSGSPFPSPGDLPNTGMEPGSPALQADSLLTELIRGGSVVKNLSANARRWDSIPGWGRSPRGGSSNPLQHFWLENSMERGDWVIVHGITKSCKELDRTERLSTLATLFLLLGYNWSTNVV